MPRAPFTASEIEATRSRLRDAALRVFEREGYAAATMRSIAREAGCSAAAPYVYFPSKEDLLAAVRADGFRDLAECLDAGAARSTDPAEQIRGIIRAYVRFGITRPDLYRLMFELRQGDRAQLPQVRASREWAFGVARRAYARLLERRGIKGDALTETHLLWLNCHGLVSLHLANQLDLGRELDKLVQPLVDHWTGPAKPVRAPQRSSARRGRRTSSLAKLE